MSILKSPTPTQRQVVKMSLSSEVYKGIVAYCQWAGFDRPADFVERAAEYVFTHDKAWQQRRKPTGLVPSKPTTAVTKSMARKPAPHKKPTAMQKPAAHSPAKLASTGK